MEQKQVIPKNEHGAAKVQVIESMRSGVFADFVVLGSQYRDQPGQLHWYLAIFPNDNAISNPKIRRVSRGIMPDGITRDEREAIAQAIHLWESEPASRPD